MAMTDHADMQSQFQSKTRGAHDQRALAACIIDWTRREVEDTLLSTNALLANAVHERDRAIELLRQMHMDWGPESIGNEPCGEGCDCSHARAGNFLRTMGATDD